MNRRKINLIVEILHYQQLVMCGIRHQIHIADLDYFYTHIQINTKILKLGAEDEKGGITYCHTDNCKGCQVYQQSAMEQTSANKT